MKLICELIIFVLVSLVSTRPAVDQRYNETITLRILNPTYSTNEIDLMKMLKSADLEGRGFQKEEFRKMLSTGNTNSSAYTTTLYYFKMVKCSGAMQIVTKLDKLFPGAFGASLKSSVASEIKNKKLDTIKDCKAGIEFHIMPAESHTPNNSTRRTKRSLGFARCCCCVCGLVTQPLAKALSRRAITGFD